MIIFFNLPKSIKVFIPSFGMTVSNAFKNFFLGLIIVLVVFGGWISYNNFVAWSDYRAKAIVDKFVGLTEGDVLENSSEKEMKDIMEEDFFEKYYNNNKINEIKAIRKKGGGEVQISEISYSPSKLFATASLNFENYEEERVVIYMEKYGSWYTTGYRWRIYKVEVFQTGVLDEIKEDTSAILQGFWSDLKSFWPWKEEKGVEVIDGQILLEEGEADDLAGEDDAIKKEE